MANRILSWHGTSGDWLNLANWDDLSTPVNPATGLPTGSDTVLFEGTGSYTATIAAGETATAAFGTIDGTAPRLFVAGTLDLTGTAYDGYHLSIGAAANGAMTISGAGALVNTVNGVLVGGGAAQANGTLTVESGGTLVADLNNDSAVALTIGDVGTGSVSVTDGTILLDGILDLGIDGGVGTLLVGIGGMLTDSPPPPPPSLPEFPGESSTIWTLPVLNDALIPVGDGWEMFANGPMLLVGNGTVAVDGGTVSLGEEAFIGAGGVGVLSVDGGGTFSANGISLGNDPGGGSGTLWLSDGLVQDTGDLDVAAGLVSVSGGTLSVLGIVDIGAGAIDITGGTVVVDALELVEAGATGTLAGGTIEITDSDRLGFYVVAGATFNAAGTITSDATDDGTITATGALTITGNLAGAGSLVLDGSLTASIGGRTVSTAIDFTAAGAVLDIATGASLTGIVSGFGSGDAIRLEGVAATGRSFANGTLTLTDASGGVVDTIDLAGNYSTGNFALTQSGGATTITYQANATPDDLNGDGKSDLLLASSSGPVSAMLMNGTTITASNTIANPGTNWQPLLTADFNGDGQSDILLEASNGIEAMWLMQGTTLATSVTLGNPGLAWHPVATGDVTGSGATDIILQNDNGLVAEWTMGAAGIVSSRNIANPGTGWHVRATGDFNGDGTSDLVLQNDNGAVAVWTMNNGTIASSATLANPSTAWRVVGTGDFTGTGDNDILLQSQQGAVAIWETDGTTLSRSVMLPDPGPTWHLLGAENLAGGTQSDLVFRNDNGALAAWVMNGTTLASSVNLSSPGLSTQVIGSADLYFIDATHGGSLAAGVGADEFILTSWQHGNTEITGFNPAQDLIDVGAAKFANFAAVTAAAHNTAGGAMIQLDASNTLTLQGLTTAQLAAKNFVFS